MCQMGAFFFLFFSSKLSIMNWTNDDGFEGALRITGPASSSIAAIASSSDECSERSMPSVVKVASDSCEPSSASVGFGLLKSGLCETIELLGEGFALRLNDSPVDGPWGINSNESILVTESLDRTGEVESSSSGPCYGRRSIPLPLSSFICLGVLVSSSPMTSSTVVC